MGLGFRFRVEDLDKVEMVLEGKITRRSGLALALRVVGWLVRLLLFQLQTRELFSASEFD